MRLTLVLQKVSYQHLRKEVWRRRGYVRAVPLNRSPYLQGVDIVDPNAAPAAPSPPELPDTPQYRATNLVTRHPHYHADSYRHEYSVRTRLMEGLQQASILTKTQVKVGLPQSVQECVGVLSIPEQDQLVQRYIMQANVWDPTKDKLPRRINKQLPGWRFKAEWGIPVNKTQSILVQNLQRLCGMICGPYDDVLTSRSLIQKPYMSVSYNLSDGSPVLLRGSHESLLTSSRPLPTLADLAEVKDTATFDLPDLYPLLPTIGLTRQQLYREDENIKGYKEGFAFPHPHTLYMGAWNTLPVQQLQTKMLMNSFGYCLASAKAKYGPDVTTLPEPISIQCVLTDGARFLFSCYQLNTADLTSTDGIKNIAWFDAAANMYHKILPKRAMLRNSKYEDYDPEVFRTFLGFYINGADLRKVDVAEQKVEETL